MYSGYEKWCKCCHEVKIKLKFSPSYNSPDGWFPFCDDCVATLRGQQIKNYTKYRSL